MDWSNILITAGEIIAALIAAGFVLKLVFKFRSDQKSSLNFISQKNNSAGGDIVAGNKSTKNIKK